MNQSPPASSHPSHRQQDIRARCFHPSGAFIEFPEAEIGRSITERFEKIVQLYPERIAVSSGGLGSTYVELNAQANQIAHNILADKTASRAPVGLLLEPGTFAIAAVMGVLKAGNIYVPLDPTYPPARMLSILDASGAGIIMTDAKNIELATKLASNNRSCLVAGEMAAEFGAENPRGRLSPGAPVAIFYTSGSTGQPKGVVQNHRTVLHRVMVDTNDFHICCEDRLSLLSSPSYSVSLRNLFGGLLNGATVCPFEASGDGLRRLKTWLIQESVTIYFSVPTVFRQFVENIRDKTEFSCLRLIYLAGESLTKEDVNLYKQYFPEAILVNSLASNEAGIIRQYFMDRNTVLSQSRVPAGYEVQGKEIIVVNEHNEPVETGEVGEICVRSRYLSPGYWQNPDLTKAVFEPDPVDADLQLYHTGDVGYFGEDGCLIHLGRKGLRVKIHGARVELEEVEAALRQYVGIRDVVVDTLKDDVEAERLIAYVVAQGQAPTITELRDGLRRNLPPYMIPSSFVFLSSLPRTPNGKIDRHALPKPDSSRPEIKAPYVPPRTADEEQLAEIWSKVLSIDPVGVRDNFFDLGGNSLFAAMLVGQINRALGANLTISAFYQAPTVEQLVRVLSQELTTFSWSSLFPIQLRGIRNPFFWIHGQASNGVLHTYLGADQPVYGMSHQCADGKPASYKTVEAIAAHYLDEIRTVRPHGPYLLGGYCFGGIVAFEMAQQLLKQNDTTSLLVLLDPPALNNCTTGSANSRSVGIWAREALNRQLKAIRARGAVTDKARGVIKQFAGSIKKQAVRVGGKLIIKFSLMFGYLIPLTLRGPYILEVYDRALAQYFPKAYPGRVVVLKAADDHRDVQHWKELVPNALDLHIVPGNHDDVLKNPYVMSWAKKLKIYLDETSGAVPESDHAHPH